MQCLAGGVRCATNVAVNELTELRQFSESNRDELIHGLWALAAELRGHVVAHPIEAVVVAPHHTLALPDL
jgi:hypothetical protein